MSPEIVHLKGAARKLAELVLAHGDYEFEGFIWLQGNYASIAEHLGFNEKTIKRAVAQSPFRHITRRTAKDGKHVLIRLGSELCETDHVYRLRAVWKTGLVYFNAVASEVWAIKAIQLKQQGAPKELWERLWHKVKETEKTAADLEKLKAGQKISYDVEAYQMGHLRGIVKALAEDAPAALACLTTFEGWTTFTAYAKAEERFSRHYHWPTLGVIVTNLDLALQTYLDTKQATADPDLAECARLQAKIDSLTPQPTV